MNKWMYILGALLIAGFAVMGMLEMIKAQTPYVTTVAEVRAAKDRPVQFIGRISHASVRTDERTDELVFKLSDDKGETIGVRYKGVKPANFDTASKAVVRGTCYGSELAADQVLLKCPSKYQGK
jgi:cytochrome c-type biogenesis protein CcmE